MKAIQVFWIKLKLAEVIPVHRIIGVRRNNKTGLAMVFVEEALFYEEVNTPYEDFVKQAFDLKVARRPVAKCVVKRKKKDAND